MGNSGLKPERLATAKKIGVIKISQQKLTEFPNDLYQLKDVLKSLDLSDNKLIRLPEDISVFHQLRELQLSKNKLNKVPDCIGALTKLDILKLSHNQLSSLPRSLSNLIHLKEVHLANNQLSEFPIVFCGLRSLDVLDLSSNKIRIIPADVSRLCAIELNLNQNELTEISPQIAMCVRLQILRLERNYLQLNAIPNDLLSKSKICVLAVEDNAFEMKQLSSLPGYDDYMERYTASKRKIF